MKPGQYTIYARTFNDCIDKIKRSFTEQWDVEIYKDYDLSTAADIKDGSGKVVGYIFMSDYSINSYTVVIR